MYRFLSLTLILFALQYINIQTNAASIAKPTCGGTTSSKYIQLKNPTNPPRECNYHINAYSKTVCQLRIDFRLTLAQPTIPNAHNELSYVKCIDDYFLVNDLKLCGVETLQHIYVPFNRTDGITNVHLQVVIAARAGTIGLPDPYWDMAVTQLECTPGAALRETEINDDDIDEEYINNDEIHVDDIWHKVDTYKSENDAFFIAPPGCLQYFPQSKGIFTSFNFDQGKGIYSGQLNYAICFRRTSDTKNFKLLNHFFHLGAKDDELGQYNVDYNCHPPTFNNDNIEDYVLIPLAKMEEYDIRATYFCGKSLQDVTIYSNNPGPLMVIFKSDGNYKPNEAGFAFSYKLLS